MSFVAIEPCKCCGGETKDSAKFSIRGVPFCGRSCVMIHEQHFREEVHDKIQETKRKYWG